MVFLGLALQLNNTTEDQGLSIFWGPFLSPLEEWLLHLVVMLPLHRSHMVTGPLWLETPTEYKHMPRTMMGWRNRGKGVAE